MPPSKLASRIHARPSVSALVNLARLTGHFVHGRLPRARAHTSHLLMAPTRDANHNIPTSCLMNLAEMPPPTTPEVPGPRPDPISPRTCEDLPRHLDCPAISTPAPMSDSEIRLLPRESPGLLHAVALGTTVPPWALDIRRDLGITASPAHGLLGGRSSRAASRSPLHAHVLDGPHGQKPLAHGPADCLPSVGVG